MAGLFTGITDSLGITNFGAQESMVKSARNRFLGLTPPELAELDIEQIGELTPEQAKAILVDQSAYEDISVDPRLRQKQDQVLGMLEEIASSGGLTAQDQAALGRIKREEDIASRGAREAILQNAQARGIGGSGLELMAQLQNQQSAATRQAQRDQEVAALAEQRKMEALLQSGQMGGQMRSQEFGEQEKVAAAKDLLNKFNVANQQQVEQQNVAARNAAQAQNLATAQDIENKKAQWKAGIPQMQFQNQMGIAQGQAQADLGLANMYGQQSQANIGAGMGLAAAFASDVRVKENVDLAPEEIDKFLSDLTGYSYEYKEPEKYGEGERLGVMAQDMEKSPMGAEAVVEDQSGMKGIDAQKAISAILASVGRLNDRLDSLEYKNGK